VRHTLGNGEAQKQPVAEQNSGKQANDIKDDSLPRRLGQNGVVFQRKTGPG